MIHHIKSHLAARRRKRPRHESLSDEDSTGSRGNPSGPPNTTSRRGANDGDSWKQLNLLNAPSFLGDGPSFMQMHNPRAQLPLPAGQVGNQAYPQVQGTVSSPPAGAQEDGAATSLRLQQQQSSGLAPSALLPHSSFFHQPLQCSQARFLRLCLLCYEAFPRNRHRTERVQ